jgi:hypothetical protein
VRQLADRDGKDHDIATPHGCHIAVANPAAKRRTDLRRNWIVDGKREMHVQVRGNELAEGTKTHQSDCRGRVEI